MWILIKYLLYNLHGINKNLNLLSELQWSLCFLLQIVVEEFLEDINNILNSGEVPNLFEKDELEQVLAATRPRAKEVGISEGNRDEVGHVTMLIGFSKTQNCVSLFFFFLMIHISLWGVHGWGFFSANIIVFLCNSMYFTSYIQSVGSPDFQRGQWEAENRNPTAPWRSWSCPNRTVCLILL